MINETELKEWYEKMQFFADKDELKPYENLSQKEKEQLWNQKKRSDSIFNNYKDR